MTVKQHELVGKVFPVHDNGHVILLDYMGNDQAVVEAARTSYQGGTKAVSDDATLVRYLMRHRHSTPTESCSIKLHIRLPITVERQMARHRTAGWSEVSGRYSVLPVDTYVPSAEHVCHQSDVNKQGSAEPVSSSIYTEFVQDSNAIATLAQQVYEKRIAQGIARETARNDLPLTLYTEKVWWINLHNMFHMLSLRMDSHAQREIRDYANVIGYEIVAKLFPVSFQAFLDYRLNAMTLTAVDQQIISVKAAVAGIDASEGRLAWVPFLPSAWTSAKKHREREEFFAKIISLSLCAADAG